MCTGAGMRKRATDVAKQRTRTCTHHAGGGQSCGEGEASGSWAARTTREWADQNTHVLRVRSTARQKGREIGLRRVRREKVHALSMRADALPRSQPFLPRDSWPDERSAGRREFRTRHRRCLHGLRGRCQRLGGTPACPCL